MKENLKTKFKHERGSLSPNTDDLMRNRQLFGRGGRRKKADTGERPPSPVKRAKRNSVETFPAGEDDNSIRKHIATLKEQAMKRKGDQAIIADRLIRTRGHRIRFIQENLLPEVLAEYPILKCETQLINELEATYGAKNMLTAIKDCVRVNGDLIIQAGEKVRVPAAKDVILAYREKKDGITCDTQMQDLTVSVACLLLPLIFMEKDTIYVIDKEPIGLTPTLYISGNPFEATNIEIHMNGTKICQTTGILGGFVATFACFYIFGVEYPQRGKKSLQMLQKIFAGLNDGAPLPSQVQRFINTFS